MSRRHQTWTRYAARAIALPCAAGATLTSTHMLALLAAAVRVRSEAGAEFGEGLRFAVLVPAHNEETQVGATVHSIASSRYPSADRRIIVVADNCSDATAAVAHAAGAEVWERSDPARSGKGFALDWAFSRLKDDDGIDAVCVVDADCEISSNLLSALAARLDAGAEAVQAAYVIANPDASDAAALRWAAFALFNGIRPLGRNRLGLSCGLLGTGMAFSRRLLRRSPWCAFSFAEDREQHMRWVLDGVRVQFAPEAQVRSPAPTTAFAGSSQMTRWDSGRAHLAAHLSPKLVARWWQTGDLTALDAALEPMLPPQSMLLGINLAAVLASRLACRRSLVRLAVGSLLAQGVYVAGGLAVIGAPATVWRALRAVPRFLLRRLLSLSRLLGGRGPAAWERTQRQGA